MPPVPVGSRSAPPFIAPRPPGATGEESPPSIISARAVSNSVLVAAVFHAPMTATTSLTMKAGTGFKNTLISCSWPGPRNNSLYNTSPVPTSESFPSPSTAHRPAPAASARPFVAIDMGLPAGLIGNPSELAPRFQPTDGLANRRPRRPGRNPPAGYLADPKPSRIRPHSALCLHDPCIRAICAAGDTKR